MKTHTVVVLAFLLTLPVSASAAAQRPPCPATPGVPAIQDIARGRCLFHSTQAFGQDSSGPYASCAICHYGRDKTDHGVHLLQITNGAGQTIEVLRKTPSLLKAAQDFPYGADGRFDSVQDVARAAILSPVEMRGTSISADQLDALAAFILALPASDAQPAPSTPPPAPNAQTLQLIAVGKTVFFGKGTCFTCHSEPDFTNHTITTDQVNLSFTGTTDPGAAFVGTGGPVMFKVPSLLFLDADRPFMHNGAIARLVQLVRFYNESLLLNLTEREMTGLEYWLRNCLDPRRDPKPGTC